MSAVRSDDLIRAPHPRLRPFVGDYVGYDISGVPAGTHLGLPSGMLTFIVSIDRPLLQVDEATDSADAFDVLLAGLHLRRTLIRHDGAMSGIQINFNPMAPRAFFGIPAGEFVHRTYDLAEISGPLAAELHDRVNVADTWSDRFDSIDEMLISVLDSDRSPRAEVTATWQQIARSHGGLPVSDVAERIGWSRRHLNTQFTAEFGIGPKEASRVLRFDHARKMMTGGPATLSDIAAACGYADQSHLNRDFRAMTGVSPRQWLSDDDVARLSFHADP
jgi:AraC-like DNA-binding protein